MVVRGAGRGVAVDDEQGPWWTRPPEPGPQAPPVRRQRITPERDVDVDERMWRDEAEPADDPLERHLARRVIDAADGVMRPEGGRRQGEDRRAASRSSHARVL